MAKSAWEKSIGIVMQHLSVSDLLRHHLQDAAGFSIAWSTQSADEAADHCRKKPPALVILSSTLGDGSVVDLARELREEHVELRLLLFSDALNRELVHQMLSAHVHGIIAAASPLPTLLNAIEVVLAGGCFFDSYVEPFLHETPSKQEALTSRERVVLQLVAQGYSTKEVADQLGVTVKTAEKFRERIMAKLDLHDAVRLTHYAIRTGICTLR